MCVCNTPVVMTSKGIVPMSISYMNRTVHVLRSDMAPDIVIKLQSLSNHTGRVWTENVDGITVFTPELSVHDTTDVTTIKAARVENTYIIEINRSYVIAYCGIQILRICRQQQQAMFVCNGSTMDATT